MYLNDVIVQGTDFTDSLEALRKVFLRFHSFNLKIKPSKCKFLGAKCNFLENWLTETECPSHQIIRCRKELACPH